VALGKTARDTGVTASMGSRGDAYGESLKATLKTELINPSASEAKTRPIRRCCAKARLLQSVSARPRWYD